MRPSSGMVPWQILDRTKSPDGAELALRQRGDEYTIRIGNIELMNSRAHLSEDTLGARAAAAVTGRPSPRLLVGGLGMGFTVRAALDGLPANAAVDVVELIPAVVTWNRGPLAALANRPLDDKRVRVLDGDVAKVIARSRGNYDAILLDVDNGPDALTAASNAGLYGDAGIQAARNALRDDGFFGVWSSFDAPRFTTRLRRLGFEVTLEPVRAYPGGGAKHVLWLGRKQATIFKPTPSTRPAGAGAPLPRRKPAPPLPLGRKARLAGR